VISAKSTYQRIVSLGAANCVGTDSSIELVCAGTTAQRIVTTLAADHVVATQANNHIRAGSPLDGVRTK
jgi:hypothetical protein